ncbi:type IX secretion system sortase PorU [Ichthyenterobacterium sp. W332]|uniref:Type IX secretion system sortase PorU n=1 Tax=Microcosmobacter mediterraneus TaxID=3075607 RepID=A0ABU2YKM7_9FLAO|nr:type IX secretion system sortase PorU [Ichthyenterobacterium sp. W332]MDT0558446.1 type IX secretion system sortase PorU [Ichthyenterobacterium sp. W332]
MKKILLTITCLFFLSIAFSQGKDFVIEWEGTTEYASGITVKEIPSFQKENFSFTIDNGITFFAQWENSSYIDEGSPTISNTVYQPISISDLKDINLKTISSGHNVKLSNAKSRDKLSAYLTLSPIIKDRGQYKKLVSFTINFTPSNRRDANDVQDITNSVLSSGNWYRFHVDKTGVFRLSKSFLNQIGINTDAVDPRNIKIFGNGGAMLPEANSEFYPLDLMENAIRFVGESDGSFDNEDYILFYAEGPTGYSDVSDTNINLYSEKSYYYVNISSGNGKRIQSMIQSEQTPDVFIDEFQDYQFYEVDEFNLAKLGRRWFGDKFDIETVRTYEFLFPNLVTTIPIQLRVLTAGISESATSFSIDVNGTNAGVIGFSVINPDDAVLASSNELDEPISVSSEDISITLTYDNAGNPSSKGYLDFISIEATRALTYNNEQLLFKNNSVATISGIVEYNISNATSVSEVWDISDKYNVTSVTNADNLNTFSFNASAGTLKNYLAFSPEDAYTPLTDNLISISNQDIKGTVFINEQGEVEDVDYIIVTPSVFYDQALRLADINRQQYGLTVRVLKLEDIYLEFSSGNPDISAIRNLVKYVYDNAQSQSGRLKYLCLFGDGSYDYKNRIPNNTNYVPSWHALSSFSLTSSFVSDDYYGMLDDNEGDDLVGSDRLDIAVGRILADSPQRAKDLVDKIQGYYANEAYGSWRNTFLGVADDVDEAWENTLQTTTNNIADEITLDKPFVNSVKILTDAYQQESSSAGDRYPDVNEAIRDAIEVGALVVNYFGHGGEDGLAKERIFDKDDAQEVNNVCKFNLFITVTCEYTKFDDPNRPTAGEFTYWNKNAGAIALITTTRQIFVTPGRIINEEMNQYLFAYGSNEYPSMAEALRLTKTDPGVAGNPQKRLVFFIGDPAMKLAFAEPNIRLTAINDTPIGQNTDNLEALSKIKMSGEVLDLSGALNTNFNGVLTATIFDKPIQRETLANDGVQQGGSAIKIEFETLGNLIFKGQASVTNGIFEFEFVVPRDITIPLGQGKVSFYAVDENFTQDKAGHSFDITVGGINENAEADNEPPIVNLFMNDENFVNGGITNESPTLLAKLSDTNGINTVSGIGHDISAILDGDETNPFILNDYYQANVDDYTSGVVSFPFRDLEPGLHTLTFKAWDVYNNSTTSEVQFVVFDKDESLQITNVLNYPNPFVDYTEFWFNHNSADSLDISVQIFTVSGKLVRTLNGSTNTSGKSTGTLSKDIIWDGRDDFGDKIGKGVYVYKLKVKSQTLNVQVEKIQKLVIL